MTIVRRKKVNILHLRSSGGLFGTEGVILNLARELKNSSFNNFVVCLNKSKSPHIELLQEAKKIGLKTKGIACRGRFDVKTIFEIRRLLRVYRIDILHCHDYKTNFFGLLASRFLNVRLVSTVHLWTKETISLRLYEFLDAILLNFFDRVVAVSDEVAREAKRLCICKRKITTIYNGIDLSKYSINPNGQRIRKELNIHPRSRIVGSVGRLAVQKGFDYLLEATKKVLQAIPEVTFLIVGDGMLEMHLRRKAQELGLENRVIFAGTRNDMIDIYNCMDIFVLPSIREGLPLVLLEALAMNKPVIATNVGGVSCVVHSNKTGILLESKDVHGLSRAITNLLQDKEKARYLARNGRRLVAENFSASSMAARYKKVYQWLKKKE